MKTKITLVLAFISCWYSFSQTVGATYTAGGINYVVTKATTPYEVAVSSNKSFIGAATIPATVSNSGNSFAVTSIVDSAFFGSGLTSITIPNSVLLIGESSFSNCESLNAVSIPSSVTSIGNYAFFGSTDLTSVTVNWPIPLKISDRSIFADLDRSTIALFVPTGSEAAYQTALVWKDFSPIAAPVVGKIQVGQQFVVNGINYVVNKETIPYEVVVGSNKLLVGATIIPPSVSYNGNSFIVTAIRNYAFESCKGLTSVSIPNSVTSIGKNAFAACYSLASVSIPDSVTSIGKNAFYFCYGLESVTIPNSVTNIEDNTFDWCRGMTSVTIPNSVTSIGASAFAGCYGLTSVTIPNSVTSIARSAFAYCYGLTSVTIPNSITSIEFETFASCSGLTSVTIPNSVTTIGDSSFKNCQKLSSVTVPNSVIRIGHSAFADCYGLTSVTIPESVMVIGNEAFVNCTSLKAVNVNWITPLNIDRSVFSKKEEYLGANGSTQVEFHPYGFEAILYVPAGTAANYKVAAVWQYFGSILEPVATPTITTFLPSKAAKGATVTFTGTGFTGATAVSFGGTAATSFTVVNDTTITAVVGSGASGNVSVTTPGGTATKAGFVINSIPTNGLIAWYPFNGNTLDNSGNSHNGVNTGATLTSDRFGNANSAYNFSGSGQFITCPNIAALNGLATATFSLWVKVNGKNRWDNGTDVNNAMYFLSRERDNASGYIGMQFSPNTQTFASGFRNGTGVGLGTTLKYPIPQPDWHHISFTLGGGFFKFYVDGELVGTTPFTAPLATSSGAINLGKLPAGSFEYYLNGVLDDVAIYGRTLDSNEIKALYDLKVIATPVITSFSPTTAAKGATITITGTNFTGATAISFGGTAATSFTVVNDTTITAVVGSGASGNVSVTTPGGTATKAGFVINSIPTNGLIAWYPFNGNTLDNSGNSNNGVNTGATLTTDRFGNANSAYNFSGSNQFITCPNIAALNGLATATFSLWVKVNGKNAWGNNSNSNAMFILSRDGDYAPGYIGMWFSPSIQTFGSGFRSGKGVGFETTLKYPVPQPEWHHISFTLGGGFFKFYVDGELVGTTPFTAPLATSSGAINLGKLPVGSFEYYLNGVLDDVAIYGRTLDSTEIKALYDLSGSLVVNKFDNKAFAYYPNPVSDELNLSYSYGLTSVKVTDIMGRQLYFKKLNENAVKVDMSGMSKGVYFVEVTSNNSSKTIKVIKK